VIAANFAFEQLKDKYQKNIYGEDIPKTEPGKKVLLLETPPNPTPEVKETPPEKKPDGLSAWRWNKIQKAKKKSDDDLTKTY
jgi:hypothetical protein